MDSKTRFEWLRSTLLCAQGEARHWAHDHTVFAQVADDASWETIEALGKLPVKTGGMTFFKDKIQLKVAAPGAP